MTSFFDGCLRYPRLCELVSSRARALPRSDMSEANSRATIRARIRYQLKKRYLAKWMIFSIFLLYNIIPFYITLVFNERSE